MTKEAGRAACNWCGRALAAGERRSIPEIVAVPASAAAAFVHAGMWTREELAKPYCARDRGFIIGLALGGAALMAAVAAFGVGLWLSGPRW